MAVEINRITKDFEELFFNFYNLYLYDLSEYTGEDPQANGKFDPTNTYLYLEREELQPYWIWSGGRPVGFILVCAPPYVDEGVDFTVQELFLLKKYRGKGIANQAVEIVLGKLNGKIGVSQLEANKPAVRFWQKFYREHQIEFTEEQESIPIEGLEGVQTILTQTFDYAGGR